MSTRLQAVVTLAALLVARACPAAEAPVAPPARVEITLPSDTVRFEPSALPGFALAQSNCSICHSTEYIRSQPPLSRATWKAEVTKMKKVFGAPLADEQMEPIIDYLARTYGTEKNTPPVPSSGR